jgi:hypothetical protein
VNATNNAKSKQTDAASRFGQLWAEYGWLTIGCLFVIMLVRSGVDKSENNEMRANRKHIADMTRTERDRLEHNQEKFRKLNATDKERIRSLHKTVSLDTNLNETLDAYHRWLGGLSPVERERVLKAPPKDRIRIIEQIKRKPVDFGPNDNHKDKDYQDANRPDRPVSRFQAPLWMRSRGGPVFPDHEFAELVETIADWLHADLKPSGDSRFPVLRYRVLIIDMMVTRVQRAAKGGRIDKDKPIIPEQLIQRIAQSLSTRTSSKVMPQLRNQPTVFLQTIVRTLGAQMQLAMESDGPTPAELERVSGLPQFKRREFDNVDNATRKTLQTRMWLEHEHGDIMKAMQRITSVMNQNKPQRPSQRRFQN